MKTLIVETSEGRISSVREFAVRYALSVNEIPVSRPNQYMASRGRMERCEF